VLTAIFQGGWVLAQLWLFWIAPLAGGALGGLIFLPETPLHSLHVSDT
jgi:glycerol uptake facilitator-like aquaporin